MAITIDCYGFPNTDSRFKKEKARFYESVTAGSITYVRFSAADICAIHRITTTDTTAKIEWTYGAWADRGALSYPYTLNDVATIDA